MATVPALLTFMEYYKDYVDNLLAVSDNIVKRGEQEESLKRIVQIMSIPVTDKDYRLEKFESLTLKNVIFAYNGDILWNDKHMNQIVGGGKGNVL